MTSATLPRVIVVGLGKLGAPLAAVLASRGFTVIGLDVSKTLVDALNAGKMPIVEPQLNELIAANRQRLSATMDANEAVEKSDASFVIVPTPSDSTGFFSNRFVLQAMEIAGQGAAQQEGLPHGGHHQHGDARHDRRRDQGRARGGVGPQGRARSRPLLQSGIHRARAASCATCCIPTRS